MTLPRLAALVTALGVIALGGWFLFPALAGHQSVSVASYTGCLTDTGTVVKIAVGDVPLTACSGTEQPFHVSGGDVTAVTTAAGSGLTGGTDNGAANLALGTTFKLPQTCNSGQVPKFSTKLVQANPPILQLQWVCGNDNVFGRATPATTLRRTLDGLGGFQKSLTIGSDGFGLIASGGLTVYHCADIVCSTGVATTIEDNGLVAAKSLAVGSDGLGLISYEDEENFTMKTAHCTNVACTSFTTAPVLNNEGIYGGISITIGSDGRGVFSYVSCCTPSGALKVAHCSNIACTSATTTPIGVNVAFGDEWIDPSVAVGADGLVLISYFKSPGGDLAVAHCSNVLCTSSTKTTIDTSPDEFAPLYADLAIGADGLGLIAYFDPTTQQLKVAHCSNISCSSATKAVVASNFVRHPHSVTIGADGLGLISYGYGTNLAVAHCTDPACSSMTYATVDTGDVGEASSVTITPEGLPLIAYNNNANNALKVAHCSNPFCVNYFRRR